eukprot:925395-Rhodomonas_salina.1
MEETAFPVQTVLLRRSFVFDFAAYLEHLYQRCLCLVPAPCPLSVQRTAYRRHCLSTAQYAPTPVPGIA